MEARANAEKEADANSARYLRLTVTTFKTEHVFQKVYTDAKFKEIQNECLKVLYLQWSGKKEIGDDVVEHLFEDRVWVMCKETRKEVPLERTCEYVVRIDMESTEATCDCKMFESAGIMCRHIISLYLKLKIKEIPEKYILRRWRKDVFRKHTMVKVAYHDPSKTEEVQNYDRMMVVFDPICLKAANYGDTHTVLETLQLLNIRLDERHAMKLCGISTKNCTPKSVGNRQLVPNSVGVVSSNRLDEKTPSEVVGCEMEGEGSRVDVRHVSCVDVDD
ncbi:hypothetical protein BVRB_027330, partial [Beta vulgaris subsp. vulgaris]